MDTKASRRVAERPHRAAYNRLGGGRSSNGKVCAYWLEGRCNKNPCRFKHGDSPPLSETRVVKQSSVLPGDCGSRNANVSPKNSLVLKSGGSGSRGKINQKNLETVCEYWVLGNCVYGNKCRYLHSWFHGEWFSRLAQLEGHKKAVTGIALPSGTDKLYSVSRDGTARFWDCNTGKCAGVINLGAEVGSLLSEGPWVFVGMPNVIKAWNIQTAADLSLTGPVGQVHTMVVGHDMLFSGVEDGAILVWEAFSETNSFQLAASLKGHSSAVVSLAVGGNMLYSGSMDCTIRVWNMDTLQCTKTLNGHTEAVMSLVCWDHYLLSCSLDQTIKVWVATEEGNLEVTYTHNEKHGILALCGICDAEGKPILGCSCNDNSVHLYELPTFSERGRIFAKQEVRSIQTGPDGLFFTGDGTGLVSVWKLLAEASGGSS